MGGSCKIIFISDISFFNDVKHFVPHYYFKTIYLKLLALMSLWSSFETITKQGLHSVVEKLLHKRIAFTLAEVLIVLGIIGLIADMTIPTLHQNISDKTTVTRLKKMYSTLESAYQLATIDEGTPDNWALGVQGNAQGAENVIKIFTKYLKNLSTEGDTSEGAWSTSKIKIADGTSFSTYILSPDCKTVQGTGKQLTNICGFLYVDLNDNKPPNKYGYDLFLFYLTKYGVYPAGTTSETIYTFDRECKFQPSSNFACTAWVLYNENVDYQRCNDLSWTGKKKCS